MRIGTHSRLHAAIGALLGLGAPVGLMVVRIFQQRSIATELREDPWLFLYVTVGSVCVMGFFGGVLGAREDVIQKLTWTDALTGLWNRRLFDRRLVEETARSVRYGTPLSLLILDLDRFKRVNDTYGHVNGDVVLRAISTIVHDAFRASDVVCRYGGEEIAIIAPNTPGSEAEKLAERTRERISQTVIPLAGAPYRITASIGIAEFRASSDPADLTRRADDALYAAKRAGRNRTIADDTVR